MTREIKHQRDALVTANEQLLDRRRFMEAVLSGVSAGVIGLDSQDRITLLSRSAEQLLGTTEAEVVGKKLAEALPMLAPALEKRDEQGMKPRGAQQVADDGRRRGAHLRRARDAREGRARRRRLGRDLRRHHRAGLGPAHRRPGPTSRAASPTRSRTR